MKALISRQTLAAAHRLALDHLGPDDERTRELALALDSMVVPEHQLVTLDNHPGERPDRGRGRKNYQIASGQRRRAGSGTAGSF